MPCVYAEWLPAYAPGVDPVEAILPHVSYFRRANYADDDHRLRDAMIGSVGALRWGERLVHSYFQPAGLHPYVGHRTPALSSYAVEMKTSFALVLGQFKMRKCRSNTQRYACWPLTRRLDRHTNGRLEPLVP